MGLGRVELGPVGKAFLQEIGGLHEFIECVYHLDDLEIWCGEVGMDLLLGDLLEDAVKKSLRIIIVFRK